MSNATLIAEYLKKHYPIEQMRYTMYVEEDVYYRIPALVFRFSQNADKNLYFELKNCVESFQGSLSWTVFESFWGKNIKNYLLAPLEVCEMEKALFEKGVTMAEKDFFPQANYKVLCEKGIGDIPNLYEHLSTILK